MRAAAETSDMNGDDCELADASDDDMGLGPDDDGDAQLAKGWSVRVVGALQSGRRRMLRYYYAARRTFQTPKYLSMSVDGSRLARKSLLVGAICTPSNEAAWCPPQAPGCQSETQTQTNSTDVVSRSARTKSHTLFLVGVSRILLT